MAKDRSGYVFIDKRTGKWTARLTFTDSNGKRRNLMKSAESKTAAKDELNRLRQRVESGGDAVVESRVTTLNAYLDRWLETAAKPRLAQRTFEDYSDLLTRYVRERLGRKKVGEVRPLDVQALYADMLNRGLSPRVVLYVHAVLNSALKQAVKWNILEKNPCESVDLPRRQRKEMNVLTPEQVGAFIEAAREDRYGVMYLVGLETGLRPEEYTGLQWSDLDLEKQTITVNRALIWNRKGGGWYFSEPKTSGSRRTVPISSELSAMLREHRKKQSEEQLKAGNAYQSHNLVFCGELGHALHPPNLLRRHFKRIVERAGLPETLRPYALRHSCATLALLAGEHPKVISERLGHSTITLTMNTYAHVTPTMQQGATDRLAKILYSGRK